MSLDTQLFDARQRATQELCRVQRENPKIDIDNLASAMDELHKAWDALTDALIAQREERDRIIMSLMNDLAELRRVKK